MKTIATTFAELATVMGAMPVVNQDSCIPLWEEKYIARIKQMLDAVCHAKLPVRWDNRRETFVFERQAPTGYVLRRRLWSDGDNWVFSDDERKVIFTTTDLTVMMERVTRWVTAKFLKKTTEK